MNFINNSCIAKPTTCNKLIAGMTCIFAITAIALSIIAKVGVISKGCLLGGSISLLILDLIWIALLCKSQKRNQPQPSPLTEQTINSPILENDNNSDEKNDPPSPEPILERAPVQEERASVQEERASVQEERASVQEERAPVQEERAPVQEAPIVALAPAIRADKLTTVPDVIGSMIFSYLSMADFARNAAVNKQWRVYAQDAIEYYTFNPKGVYPKLTVFDGSDWARYVDLEAYGLSVDYEPPLDERTARTAIERMLSLEIEEDAGWTLITLPKGLTLNKYIEIMLSPEMGYTQIRHISKEILTKLGNVQVPRTTRELYTNHIFKGSWGLSHDHRKALMKKNECEMVGILGIVAVMGTGVWESGERSYNYRPYTRCVEEVCGYQCIVGGFTPGPGITSPAGITICNVHFGSRDFGVGGVFREL